MTKAEQALWKKYNDAQEALETVERDRDYWRDKHQVTYPDSVQKKIDFLNEYTNDDTLNKFDLFHIYPKELAYPDGYYDARFSEVVGYHWSGGAMLKRTISSHTDAIDYIGVELKKTTCFADGSFVVRFAAPVKVEFPTTQCLTVAGWNK